MRSTIRTSVMVATVVLLAGCSSGTGQDADTAAVTTGSAPDVAATSEPLETEPVETAEPEAAPATEEPEWDPENPFSLTDEERRAAADLVDELQAWMDMDERQFKGELRGYLRSDGREAFCAPVEEGIVYEEGDPPVLVENPGHELIGSLLLAAALEGSTQREDYGDVQVANLSTWINQFFDAECDWEWITADAGVEDAEQEREANRGAAEALGPDEVHGWTKERAVSVLESSDQATQDLFCQEFLDLDTPQPEPVVYGEEFYTWTPEEQQAAMLWTVDWGVENCL